MEPKNQSSDLPKQESAAPPVTADAPLNASTRPLPVVDARFPSRIADGIWVIPDKRIPLVPNIGIVEGSRAVLVIDCGFNEESGRNTLNAARAIAGERTLILTVTHAHPEHTFGAQAFEGHARIYYNKLQRDYLAHRGENLLAGFRAFMPPEQHYLLEGIRITLADDVYEGATASLDLGGRQVNFHTWGTVHSPGDQVISVPDQRVIFAGDLIEERIFPIIPFYPPLGNAEDFDLRTWETALTDIIEQGPHIIVPGHGNLGGVEIAQQVRQYLADIRQLLTPANVANKAVAEVIREFDPLIQNRYPTWERGESIAPAISYFVEQANA